MKKIILSLYIFLNTPNINAQNTPLGGWWMYFGNASFSHTKWKANYDIQWRNHELATDLNQLLIRASTQYTVAENLTLGLGYAHITSENIGTPNLTFFENRIFQDAISQQNILASTVKHRLRYEQRFVEKQNFKTRLRYQITIEIPWYKNTETNQSIYSVAYNEIFINTDKKSRKTTPFDRNRLYMGIGYKWNTNTSIQAGWMNQMLLKTAHQQLMLSLHHNIKI